MPWELFLIAGIAALFIWLGVLASRRSDAEWEARPRPGDIYVGKPKTEQCNQSVWVAGSYQMLSGRRFVVFSWTSEQHQCAGDSMDLADFVGTFKKVPSTADVDQCA